MSDIDPSTDLSDALSELIAFDSKGRAVWPAKELEARLTEPLGQLIGENDLPTDIQTVRQLLEHSNPPLKLLSAVKDFSKRRPRDLVPPEMALLLYYGSIAAAMVRCGKRITKLRDEHLRDGFTWAIKQPWVPESVCALLRGAISKVGGGQNWRE